MTGQLYVTFFALQAAVLQSYGRRCRNAVVNACSIDADKAGIALSPQHLVIALCSVQPDIIICLEQHIAAAGQLGRRGFDKGCAAACIVRRSIAAAG